jgi:hypothetical protein
MGYELVDGLLFAEMVKSGARNLERNRTTVNELNVFPIPDGDTGDNMYMTIDSGASELDLHASASLTESAAACAHGMLLGARGNSGVILSRIFSGISRGLEGLEDADLSSFCRALEFGIDEAYKAVAVPVEGTILTVYKDAVVKARENLTPSSTLESFFADLVEESRRSLERTPELLDVLRDAGVVDSGGAGLIYIAEGMERALNDDRDEETESLSAEKKKRVDIERFTEDSVLEYGYCTEFLLRLQSAKCDISSVTVEPFLEFLGGIGDSVVCFRDGSVLKVHVHTMTPGAVLDYFQRYGEFLTLKIENMTLQHNESLGKGYVPPKKNVRKKFGVVSVASGEGLCSIFSELGCDEVVSGGQSMNPSAKDFIRAFERVNADTIFVFPNNSNVILTARQAASLYKDSDVRVLETKTVGEGYAAISMLEYPEGDADETVAALTEVIESVVTGFISRASRESAKDGVEVREGDYIGFEDGRILVCEKDRVSALKALCRELGAEKYDVMLLICGEGADKKEARGVCRELGAEYRRTEVISLDGGQPIHDYIVILE